MPKAPARSLGEYLLLVVMNKEILESLKDYPEEALKKSGLEQEDKDLLLKGDLHAILDELYEEYGKKPGDHLTVP